MPKYLSPTYTSLAKSRSRERDSLFQTKSVFRDTVNLLQIIKKRVSPGSRQQIPAEACTHTVLPVHWGQTLEPLVPDLGATGIRPLWHKKSNHRSDCLKLAHKDSNLEMTESESVALPFGDGPIFIVVSQRLNNRHYIESENKNQVFFSKIMISFPFLPKLTKSPHKSSASPLVLSAISLVKSSLSSAVTVTDI